MGRILSGIKPTSELTLGNYLGALKNWVAMQDAGNDCFYMIADLHAYTVPQDPKEINALSYHALAGMIGCGLDPKKSTLFAQSSVPAHTQLGWIFECHTSMGWLDRMTQFKEKAGKHKERSSAGLYTYPALQAADILIYHPDAVPVGEDQKQHVELTRDIVNSFHVKYGVGYFKLPEPIVPKVCARVKSLRDGAKKMSKSDPSDMSRINLLDDADTIAQKIRKAKTDPEPLPSEKDGLKDRLEAENLVTIYAVMNNQSVDDVLTEFGGKEFSAFKPALADLLVEKLSPMSQKMHALLNDQSELDSILREGRDKAATIADQTVKDVMNIMGFVRP